MIATCPGSGLAEVVNKTLVTQRMKHSGIRWSIAGGQAVPSFPALIIDGPADWLPIGAVSVKSGRTQGGQSWTPTPHARVNFQTTFPTMWASSARHS